MSLVIIVITHKRKKKQQQPPNENKQASKKKQPKKPPNKPNHTRPTNQVAASLEGRAAYFCALPPMLRSCGFSPRG